MQARRAYTPFEGLLLILILFLIFLLLTCCMGPCHPDDLNARCADNLRSIGQAMYIYAQDDPGVFPAIAPINLDGQMRIFDPVDRVTLPSTTGIPSPTVDLWTLVRGTNAMPSKFICPWTDDEPDPALFPKDYFDFLSAQHLSYAYQYQHDPNRRVVGTATEPNFPFMADGNPYIKGGILEDIYTDRLSDAKGNSTNHQFRQNGQNVLFVAGHVELRMTPAAGLYGEVDPELGGFGFDNIYTAWIDLAPIYIDPGSFAPTSTSCNLGGRSDACLVP